MSGEQMTCKGTLKGHNGWITQIATTPVFPDMLLSASRDKTTIMGQSKWESGIEIAPAKIVRDPDTTNPLKVILFFLFCHETLLMGLG